MNFWLHIYYIINFLFFQVRGKALGQLTAYLLLFGIGYLLPSIIRANNCFIFQSTSGLDTVSWSTRTSPHPRRQSHPTLYFGWTKSTIFSAFDFNPYSWALSQAYSGFPSSNRLKILDEIKVIYLYQWVCFSLDYSKSSCDRLAFSSAVPLSHWKF